MWRSPTRKALLRDIRIRQLRAELKRRLKWLAVSSWRALLNFNRWLWGMVGIKAQDIYVATLVSKRHDELYKIGEKCYELYRRGHLVHDELVAHLKRVEMLDSQIDAWEIERKILLPSDVQLDSHNSKGE
ncbi:MAG: hypothetical protein RMK18_06615 [Armatimonadota bacterium]|nr:hypothetical protein [Armatimonadota bacterium]MCX7777471.1 hypothetical protein [Armatimonadota bacterium]MDW8025520.1 hypothetical protein [Armatimonadota bacterium]